MRITAAIAVAALLATAATAAIATLAVVFVVLEPSRWSSSSSSPSSSGSSISTTTSTRTPNTTTSRTIARTLGRLGLGLPAPFWRPAVASAASSSSSSSSSNARQRLLCSQVQSSQLHGPLSNAQAADLVQRILASSSDQDDSAYHLCPLRPQQHQQQQQAHKPYVSWRPNSANNNNNKTNIPTNTLSSTPNTLHAKPPCTSHPDFCESLYPLDESDRITHLIYDHQNPPDCSKAQFLVLSKEWHSGLGSNIHVKAWMLLVAILANRVLIDSRNIKWDMTNPSNCPQQDWTCYFAPITKCTLPKDWEHSQTPEFDPADLDLSVETTTTTKGRLSQKRQYVRTQAHPQPLNGAMVMGQVDTKRLGKRFFFGGGAASSKGNNNNINKPNSWWMTHATVYLIRPNERTLDIACWYWRCMPNNSGNKWPGGGGLVASSSLSSSSSSSSTPSRPTSTTATTSASIFVRSGDKWKEANLRTAQEHFDALESFAQSNPSLRPSVVYFGTDDALVLSDVVRQYSTKYNLTWIGYHREAKGLTFEEAKTRYYSPKVEWQVLVSLADLYISALADLFVGALSSNWCRLTDELRKAHGKAGMPYLTPQGEALVAGV